MDENPYRAPQTEPETDGLNLLRLLGLILWRSFLVLVAIACLAFWLGLIWASRS